jgi:sugar phosphate isomerase/epimerase
MPGFFWGELEDADQEELIAARSTFARGAIHAPVADLPLVSSNPYVEREAMRQMHVSIAAAGVLDLEVVTVHPTRPNSNFLPKDQIIDRLVTNLRALGDKAQQHGTRIGVENLYYPATADEHARLLELIDHPAVGATIDTGHIHNWFQRDGVVQLPEHDGAVWFNARLLELIDRLGERIFHLHVDDIALPRMYDQHLPAGRGMIDFEAVVRHLRHWGFTGLLEPEHNFFGEPEQEASEARAHMEGVLAATATP